MQNQRFSLGLHDLPEVERSGEHDDAHDGKPHVHLVAQHLGHGPETPDEGVFIVRRPAARATL